MPLIHPSSPRPVEPGPEGPSLRQKLSSVVAEPFNVERLFQAYGRRIMALCRRLLAGPAYSEDVVQDVFMSVLRTGHLFRQQCSDWTWLSAITVNCCRDRNRRAAATRRHIEASYRPYLAEAADVMAVREETFRAVRAAVAKLPPYDREVVRLFYFEGHSFARISERTGASRNAIRIRLHRARRKLAADLR